MAIESRSSGGGGVYRPESKDASCIYAALDLGTNNCRLLVARPTLESGPHNANGIRVIDSFSRIVRLGEDVSATGKLSDSAMERTLEALKQCKSKLARHAVTHARFVATEACRQALNAKEFLLRVEDETGITIDIISNEEEAKLAFLGCASLLKKELPKAIVFDIGGGSTEFMWVEIDGSHYRIIDWTSLPSGVMNLTERYGGNAFAEMYFEEMVKDLMEKMVPFDTRNNISATMKRQSVQMLSTSGTVTTLAAVHMGLQRYDRSRIDGLTLPISDVSQAVKKLVTMRQSERFNHPCIGADRSDFILSGCAIFEAITRSWGAENITIADRGVREGIIVSLMHGETAHFAP